MRRVRPMVCCIRSCYRSGRGRAKRVSFLKVARHSLEVSFATVRNFSCKAIGSRCVAVLMRAARAYAEILRTL